MTHSVCEITWESCFKSVFYSVVIVKNVHEHYRQKLAYLSLHGFSGPFGPKWRFWGQNRGRHGVMLTPNELVLTFGGCYLCVTFGENRWRNATVDRQTYRQTHAVTETNWIYDLSHAIYAIAMGQIIKQLEKYAILYNRCRVKWWWLCVTRGYVGDTLWRS